MRSKTDFRAVLTDPLHWMRIVLYVVIATVVLGSLQHYVNRRSSQGGWCAVLNTLIPMADPAVLAGGIEMIEASNAFAGYGSRGVWRGDITAVMMSMVFLYIVGPTLLVWGLRGRARFRRHEPGTPPAAVIAVAIAAGCCSVMLLVPGFRYAYSTIGEHERDIARVAAMEDEAALKDEMLLMAHKAQVAYFVAGEPWQVGGSWQMSDGSRQPALSIVQLIDPGAIAVIKDSRHALIGGRSYELIVERADSLTLRGQCPPIPPEVHGEPIFGNNGARDITIGVTPSTLSLAYNQ